MKAVKKPVDPPKFDPKKVTPEQFKRMKSFAQPAKGNIKPSYPELYAIAAGQAMRNAKSSYKGLDGIVKSVNYKKALSAFGADVAVDSAIDYVDDKRKKK
jgi:hypothetical protein